MAKTKKSAAAAVDALAEKLAVALSKPRCSRLLHLYIAGSHPSITPGCPKCMEVKEQHDAWAKANPPAPAPKPAPTDKRRASLDDDL